MAVRSFLACQFAPDPDERTRGCNYLVAAFARYSTTTSQVSVQPEPDSPFCSPASQDSSSSG